MQNWQKIPARNRDTGIPVPGTDFPNALKQLNPRIRPTTESRAQATEIKPLEIVSVIKMTFEKLCECVVCWWKFFHRDRLVAGIEKDLCVNLFLNLYMFVNDPEDDMIRPGTTLEGT